MGRAHWAGPINGLGPMGSVIGPSAIWPGHGRSPTSADVDNQDEGEDEDETTYTSKTMTNAKTIA